MTQAHPSHSSDRRTAHRASRTSPRDPMMVPLAHVEHDPRRWEHDRDRDQLTFGDIEPSALPPSKPSVAPARTRSRAHAHALETAERTGVSTNAGRQRVIDEVSCWLDIYIRCLGVGARFQAADFHNWLIDINREPPAEHFTPQALGALFLARARPPERLLRNTGIYQADAPKRHSSSKRPVWEIMGIRSIAPRDTHAALEGAEWTAPKLPSAKPTGQEAAA